MCAPDDLLFKRADTWVCSYTVFLFHHVKHGHQSIDLSCIADKVM